MDLGIPTEQGMSVTWLQEGFEVVAGVLLCYPPLAEAWRLEAGLGWGWGGAGETGDWIWGHTPTLGTW